MVSPRLSVGGYNFKLVLPIPIHLAPLLPQELPQHSTYRLTTTPSNTAFAGKVIAVTGGGQGIGLATAKVLASRAAKVSIADAN